MLAPDSMDICAQIKAARDCGVIRCAHVPGSFDLGQLAEHVGLATTPEALHEITATTARRLCVRILTHDRAYVGDLGAPAIAERLVETYFSAFPTPRHRYFTNTSADPAITDKWGRWLDSWAPFTKATFDTGVLIVGPAMCGVLWVEDED